jgi:chemotaxis protein CheD
MPVQQQIETVEPGEIRISSDQETIFAIPNLGTGVALAIYDNSLPVGAIAHIVLPESTLTNTHAEELPGKYANLAIPALLEKFTEAGGQKRNSVVRIVGGAQLFNFGGGGGNILNIGARNATAIRAAMSKHGFVIQKADTGGNKGKSLQFILSTGQLIVCPIGGHEYPL